MTEIINELDTVTRCRVENCRLTRPEHHKFRAKKSDTSVCRTCGARGKWHPDHTPEWGYAPTNEDVLVSCSCGNVAKTVTGLTEFPAQMLVRAGWSLIKGEWHCPKCTQKWEERQAKAQSKRDQRQGSFL